jgi:hypothetical protein
MFKAMTESPLSLHSVSRTRMTFVLLAVATLLVAACGGDTTSSRNRQLNTVLCYNTQEEKDAAIAEAERALNEANPPSLEDASGVGSVAFIGPKLWWRKAPRAVTTTTEVPTTTVAPSETSSTTTTVVRERTIGSPSNLRVRDTGSSFLLEWNTPSYGGFRPERFAVLWEIDGGAFSHVSSVPSYEMPYSWFRAGATVTFSIRSDNDSERLYSDWSNRVTMQVPSAESTSSTTSSTVASSESSEESSETTESGDESSETTIPLVGDVVIQQLQAQLEAATNAPLCSNLEASSDSVDTESVDGVTTQDDVTETAESSGPVAECDAHAGYDLNARTAFVTPCEAATMVRITFDDPSQGSSEVVTSGGSTVNVAIPDGESNFSFVVFVGSQEATSGSVEYPLEPQIITNEVPCPVQASLTEVSGEPYGQPRAWLMQVDACDAALVGLTSYQYSGFRLGPQFSRSMVYGMSDVQRVVVRVTVGEQLIAELDVPAGQTLVSGGTYETAEFAPVTEQFSGEYLAEPDPAADSEEESGDESVETVTCSGTYESRQLSFDCAESFRVMVDVIEESGYGPRYAGTNASVFDITMQSPRAVWAYLSTDSGAILWPITILVDNINYGGPSVAGSVDGSGTFEFEVPVGDCCEEEDFGGGDDEEEPDYFEGALLPSVGDQELTMTLPNPYPYSEFWLELTYECSAQNVTAMVYGPDGQPIAQFVDMEPYNILSDGRCGVFLSAPADGSNTEIFAYAVILTADTDAPIDFYGTATLQGAGVIGDPDFFDEEQLDITWDDWVEQEVTAPNHFEITIPDGGRWFEAIAPTGQGDDIWNNCDGACIPFVDPELLLYRANGDWVDHGGEDDQYGTMSKSLRIFLPEGIYVLKATTFDIENPDLADPQALNTYTLRFRTEQRQVPTVVIDASGEPQVLNPPTVDSDADTEISTTTTVPATSTTTTTTTVPAQSTEEQIVESVLEPVGVIVVQIDEPKTELEAPPPGFAFPVAELIGNTSTESASATSEVEPTTLPSVAIPAGITEIICDSECLSTLRESAGIEDGVVEIQLGAQVILVDSTMREVVVPITPRARQIRVTVTPPDGGEPVVLTRDIVVLSPSNVPLKPGPTFTSGARVTETSTSTTSDRSAVPFVVAAIVVALGAAIVIRRRGVRPTE